VGSNYIVAISCLGHRTPNHGIVEGRVERTCRRTRYWL